MIEIEKEAADTLPPGKESVEEGETEDGGYVVKLYNDEVDPYKKDLDQAYDKEGRNLVFEVSKSEPGKKWLRKFADEVIDRFENDWKGSEGRRSLFARNWALFTGDLPQKDLPFAGCANVNVPIILENISRVSFRAMDELFGDWTNVYAYVSADPETEEVTNAMSRHGNWQLRTGITDFKRQMHRMSLLFFFDGDVSVHSYYDELSKQNKHEVLLPDEFVTPAHFCSTEPDYSDMPWYTRVLRWYPHQLEAMAEDWFEVDKVLNSEPPSWSEDPDSEILSSVMASTGIDEPDDDGSAPYKLLHHEGWYKLPGQKRRRWIQCVIDTSTKGILCLRICEREDWRDRTRFEHQELELEEYQKALQDHDQMVAQISAQHAQNVGSVGEMMMIDPTRAQQLGEAIPVMDFPPPPVAPSWTVGGKTSPDPVRKLPVRMFSHGVLIEPLRGSTGISYGRMQGDYARAANLAMNQFSDAAHLSNIKSWIGSAEAEFETKFEISPGKINKLKNVAMQDLDKVLRPVETGPANPQLIDLVQMISQMAESSMQAPAVLSGEAGKSGETARGHASRVEQASKQLSVATSKLADLLTQILKNNAVLNSIFMEDEEVFAISDKWGTGKIKVKREWFNRGYSIEVRSDLKYSSDSERVDQADQMLMLPQQVPQLQGNLPFVYMTVKRALETRGMHDMVRYIGPQPPPPMTPLGVPETPPMPPGMPQEGAPTAEGGPVEGLPSPEQAAPGMAPAPLGPPLPTRQPELPDNG